MSSYKFELKRDIYTQTMCWIPLLDSDTESTEKGVLTIRTGTRGETVMETDTGIKLVFLEQHLVDALRTISELQARKEKESALRKAEAYD